MSMTPQEIDQLAEALVMKMEKVKQDKTPPPLEESNFEHWEQPSAIEPIPGENEKPLARRPHDHH
jgi:hypothetical protein